MTVSSFCTYIFNINIGREINKINIEREINKINIGREINRINIGRKKASSKWLIPIRKIESCK